MGTGSGRGRIVLCPRAPDQPRVFLVLKLKLFVSTVALHQPKRAAVRATLTGQPGYKPAADANIIRACYAYGCTN
jgi:hypothetical protein